MSQPESTIGVVSNYTSPKKRLTYYSYLLRLRWVENAGRPTWRISLEEPGSQTQIQFVSLAAVCAYLTEQIGLGETRGNDGDEDEKEDH